ncbi:hypothetical protein EMIT0P228_10137 [Pseudomonas brassicacearum]
MAMTSVQLTTPRRTFWHAAGSAAMAAPLSKVVPQSASTQELISRFMSGSSAAYCYGFRHLRTGDAKLRSPAPGKTHSGDVLLHCSDS